MKKIYVKNYGCQMNVYDGDKMIDLLRPHNYEPTDNPDDADIAILNTCHIREKAEHKVFSDLGRLKINQNNRQEQKKEMIIAVAGCVAQAQGEEIIKQAPYVSMVFGPQTIHELPEMIEKVERKIKGKKQKAVNTNFPIESKFDYFLTPTQTNSSAFLSIQEGCDKFCHFCVVPYTRGAQYSRPVDKIIKEAQDLVDLGAIEITLLGQNVNAYNAKDSKGIDHNFGKLLFEIAKISKLKRIRYTTSHPLDMHEELYIAHRDIETLMPYLHLPVQSGSDRILKAMNRKHNSLQYLKIIERLKKERPDIAFSSDFIVGYPGENDEDHKQSINLINTVQYAQAYSFKYSPRPGTPASILINQIDEEIKSNRLYELQDTLAKHQLNFNKNTTGKVLDVLFDKTGKQDNQIIGKSPYMQSVVIDNKDCLEFGNICSVKIKNGYQNSLIGEVV